VIRVVSKWVSGIISLHGGSSGLRLSVRILHRAGGASGVLQRTCGTSSSSRLTLKGVPGMFLARARYREVM
jgi:hypothetical protein